MKPNRHFETPVTSMVIDSHPPANDLVASEPANDNFAPCVDKMLHAAGYDPTRIPAGIRREALWVAHSFADGLSDARDIARACDLTPREVKSCMRTLRRAVAR